MFQFENPFLFLLFIPVCILAIFFFKSWRKRKTDYKVIFFIRMIVFSLLIFALTKPSFVFPVDEKQVIFLVDSSESVTNLEDDVLNYIEKSLESKDVQDEYAIISFAENAIVEQSFKTKNSDMIVDLYGTHKKGHTNIEKGLLLATSMFEQKNGGRIVLFTDGQETTGNVSNMFTILKEQGIEVDIVPIEESKKLDMAITQLDVSNTIYEGERASVQVRIRSNYKTKASIRLSVNDRDFLTEEIEVKEGDNIYSFNHLVDTTGLVIYKAEIADENDYYIENNQLYSVANVLGTPKILVVETDETSLSSILQNSGLIVKTVKPEQLPTTLSHFLEYESIVFNNIPATLISEAQMMVIEEAVNEFGKGFIMLGGENSFGLGGYFKTPIERLLPVDMEIKSKEKLPSLGLMIVIDRSGSMEGSKLSLAKEAAARSVALLREEDTLGVIAFDDRPWVIVESGPIVDKEKVENKIRTISPGGGTEIYESLKMAYDDLLKKDLERKHIILLTDGQSAIEADYFSLIEKGNEKNITLSTVAIGDDADKGLLEQLANKGNGRFYDVVDATVIPSILSRETVMMTRTYIVDEPFYPTVYQGTSWEAFFTDGIPQMNAYIATTLKPTASVSIESKKEDPILAEWQYGLGKTIAFTSDITGKWSGQFASWSMWPNFVNHLISKTLPEFGSHDMSLDIMRKEDYVSIVLDTSSLGLFQLETSVVSDKGEKIEGNLKLISPGKYELQIPDQAGLYFINATRKNEKGDIQVFQSGFSIPYSDEYLYQGKNDDLIERLTSETGGSILDSEEQVFRDLQSKMVKRQEVSLLLLVVAFLLLFIEFVLKRLGLSYVLHLLNVKRHLSKVKIESQSNQTTTQLLKLKDKKKPLDRKISFECENESEPTIPIMVKDKTRTEESEQSQRKQEEVKQHVTPSNREEQLNRLLQAKKRRK